MQHQVDLFLYKFRFLCIGILIIAFFIAISALIAAIGSNSILDTRTGLSASALDATPSDDDPNAVTSSIFGLMNGTKRVLLSVGIDLYGACRSTTMTTARGGRSVVRAGAVVTHSVGSGVAFAAHGVGGSVAFTSHAIGSGAMFTIRLPGKTIGSITHRAHAMGAIIRPADNNPVPIINTNLPPAILANLKAQAEQDQQKSAELQAAQLVANRGLGGSIVAGDPNHGGYPTRWDTTSQDSMVDSWGMYNRECVSYAAWKVYQTYGDMPFWGGVGNANQWVHDAKVAGIPTGQTPQVHSVAISMYGYYGHAMWVEAVNGNMVYVSQYNYDLHGHYSEMWVNGSNFTYIYFK